MNGDSHSVAMPAGQDDDQRSNKIRMKKRRESFELLLRELYDQCPLVNDTFSDTSSTCEGWQHGTLSANAPKYTRASLVNEGSANINSTVTVRPRLFFGLSSKMRPYYFSLARTDRTSERVNASAARSKWVTGLLSILRKCWSESRES
ncbi:unnamed protein product [Soboliphyme baturini]|uniref:BHLH domain-containing protein n=1 Tax=Soboliphyme baturini TaxID=241478 RepID=A0A183IKN6_9BILA|nr:unnamed protein product [Soboliphyme baturini]